MLLCLTVALDSLKELGECGSLAPSRASGREGRDVLLAPGYLSRETGVCRQLQQRGEARKEKRVFVLKDGVRVRVEEEESPTIGGHCLAMAGALFLEKEVISETC